MNIFKSVTSLSNSAVKAITNSAMAINYLSGFLSGSARESADPSTTATTAPGGPGAPVGPSAPRGPGAPLTGSSSHRAPSTTNSIPTTLDNIDFDDLKVKLLNEIDILKETSQATPYYERQITKICSLIDEQITQSNNAKTYSYGDIVFNDKGYDGDKTKKSKSETNKFASLRETEKADLYYKHVLKRAIDESFPYETDHPEIKEDLNTIVENWARENTAQKPTFYNLLMGSRNPSTEKNFGTSFFAILGVGIKDLFSSSSPPQDKTPPQQEIVSNPTTPSTETEHRITASFSTRVQVFAKSGSRASSPSRGPGSRASSPSQGSSPRASSQGSSPRASSQGSGGSSPDSPPTGPSRQPVVVSTQPGPTSFPIGPQERGPQEHGRQGRRPQERGPKRHGPQGRWPQGRGPQRHGPQGRGPQGHGPQGRGSR